MTKKNRFTGKNVTFVTYTTDAEIYLARLSPAASSVQLTIDNTDVTTINVNEITEKRR